VPRRPRRPRAQGMAQAMTPAKVAGPASPNSAIEVQLQCRRCLRIARIAQSVTPVTVIHLTASAQSRVATLHLIVHELLAVLVVSVVIAMPAPHGRGGAECREPGVTVAHRRSHVVISTSGSAWHRRLAPLHLGGSHRSNT
jgi:hypothetical protein